MFVQYVEESIRMAQFGKYGRKFRLMGGSNTCVDVNRMDEEHKQEISFEYLKLAHLEPRG